MSATLPGKPSCKTKAKCRIHTATADMLPLRFYMPLFDGAGRNINPDQNASRLEYRCMTCGKTWTEGP